MTGTARYYSQQGEDCLLWHFFDRKPNGFFVDVGALDGIYLSNTRTFEEQGWDGICIEALPDMHALCRASRPRSRCVHAACVGDGRTEIAFRRDPSGVFSGIAPDENAAAAIYRQKSVNFLGFETITVPAATLNALLAEIDRPIDFMSIDVEGAEIDVLAGLDLDRFRPRVLLLEANTAEEKRRLDRRLAQSEYLPARSRQFNHFYVRNLQDARKLRGIGFRARLEEVAHPLGASYNAVGDMPRLVWWTAEGDGTLQWIAGRLRRSVHSRLASLWAS